MFLAWQTWVLLRLTIEGFTGLCSDFLVRNPGYFIKPIRINGSVIESLFGRFKYNSGGNLSSVNYRNCVAKLVIADASNAKEDYTVLTSGNPQDDKQMFLAWQTWVLLRLTIEGVTGLCSDFLVRNPGYFIKPIRINGSVIESLFGRFKYNSGGNLSSVNYRNCVAKLVIADASNAKEDYRAVTCDHIERLVNKKYH